MTDYVKFGKNTRIYSLVQQLNKDVIADLLKGKNFKDANDPLQIEINKIIKETSKLKYGKQFPGQIVDIKDNEITVCYIVKYDVLKSLKC